MILNLYILWNLTDKHHIGWCLNWNIYIYLINNQVHHVFSFTLCVTLTTFKSTPALAESYLCNTPEAHQPNGIYCSFHSCFNSLFPGRSGLNFKCLIFKCNVAILWAFLVTLPLREWHRTPLMIKSTLVQLMACCHQATSHYLNQCWLKSMMPYIDLLGQNKLKLCYGKKNMIFSVSLKGKCHYSNILWFMCKINTFFSEASHSLPLEHGYTSNVCWW